MKQTISASRINTPPLSRVCLSIYGLMCVLQTGCEADSRIPATEKMGISSHIVFDSGVVFSNEASYQCFPLQQLGITENDQVTKVTSSCECVQPSIIEYIKAAGQTASALRIDFVEDPIQDDADAVNLSVELKFVLADGGDRRATINFLQTSNLKFR